MNEEFDDRLKNRITEIFDNYEDDSADEGWLLLREKYPEQEKRRAVAWLWWGSAAAILLIFVGFGLWLNNNINGNKTNNSITKNNILKSKHHDGFITQKIAKPLVSSAPDSLTNSSADRDKLTGTNTRPNQTGIEATSPYRIKNNIAKLKTIVASGTNAGPVIHHSTLNPHSAVAKNNTRLHRNRVFAINKHHQKADKLHQQKLGQSNNDETEIAALTPKNASSKTLNKPVDSVTIAGNSTSSTKTKATILPPVKEPRKNLFATAGNEPKKINPTDKKIKLGIYAATYFNYAKGSDNEFNVGAGLAAEVSIIGNLKLVTGIGLSQNSLDYKSAIPQTASTYLVAAISPDLKASASFTPGTNIASTLNVQNYQASLIGLDIPVNLKYQFNQSDTYISAGVSSGTYVNETYQYVYNYASAYSIATPQSQNNKSQSSFGSFDFARTLNVAFGMGYPLGKTNRLIVEPFLKYPLDGLGTQQIKFGAGGINLKFNFLSTKK